MLLSRGARGAGPRLRLRLAAQIGAVRMLTRGGCLPGGCDSKLPNGGTRPSFDKGVEYDGPIAPGKRARDLTIYNTYNGLTN